MLDGKKMLDSFVNPAILGANTRSLQIAALFANAGISVSVCDRDINTVISAIENLYVQTPAPLCGSEAASLIIPREFISHRDEFASYDLIIDALDMQLDERKKLLSRLAAHFSRSAAVISLSDGESISEISKILPTGMENRFLTAHFSRHPRYHRLIELIPTSRSEERLILQCQDFFSRGLGSMPQIVQESSNLIADRILIFAVCNAFYHARRLHLDIATMEAATALIIGNSTGGISLLAQHFGFHHLTKTFARISSADKKNFSAILQYPSPLTVGKRQIYSFTHNSAEFAYRRVTLSHEIREAFNNRDWLGLESNPQTACVFICAFLRDFWQYLQLVAAENSLSGEEIDFFIYHAFDWPLKPYELLQQFPPAKIFSFTKKSLDKGKISYSISEHWKRRSRNNKKIAKTSDGKERKINEKYASDALLEECQLLRETQIARHFQYQNQMMIWQPKAEEVDLSGKVLEDLQNITKDARQKHNSLLIYALGKRFGGLHHWRGRSLKTVNSELSLFYQTLIEIRMSPAPIIFSASGEIADEGLALMMQADRIVADADLSWKISTLDENLPPIGAIWFEWLRRLPRMNSELSRLQTHTVISFILNSGGSGNMHIAREIGLLRSHDRCIMNPAQMPEITKQVAQAWIHSIFQRPLRYPIYKSEPQDANWFNKRSESTTNPQMYRDLIALLSSENQPDILSLRRFLHEEFELFLKYL
ncbi:MAG: hypothetical protein IJ566_08565 [Cardiobacteriaceae bacterium]|nr:hypothetical protein [Cardiobacteriaceae bacterium]